MSPVDAGAWPRPRCIEQRRVARTPSLFQTGPLGVQDWLLGESIADVRASGAPDEKVFCSPWAVESGSASVIAATDVNRDGVAPRAKSLAIGTTAMADHAPSLGSPPGTGHHVAGCSRDLSCDGFYTKPLRW